MLTPFHLATHVDDLEKAKEFYTNVLGCKVGREATRWVDLDFFGHQLSLHLGASKQGNDGTDGERSVPMPHFGPILDLESWHNLRDKLEAAGVDFVIEPTVRFEGKPGEQRTMFFRDPAGNVIEIKGFASMDDIFRPQEDQA
jgi:extradiol dioxygenase family protein